MARASAISPKSSFKSPQVRGWDKFEVGSFRVNGKSLRITCFVEDHVHSFSPAMIVKKHRKNSTLKAGFGMRLVKVPKVCFASFWKMRGFTATFNSMGIIQHLNQGITYIYIYLAYIIYTYDYIYVYVSYKLSSITFFAIKATCPKNQKKQPLIQRQDTERKHGLRWCACPEAACLTKIFLRNGRLRRCWCFTIVKLLFEKEYKVYTVMFEMRNIKLTTVKFTSEICKVKKCVSLHIHICITLT